MTTENTENKTTPKICKITVHHPLPQRSTSPCDKSKIKNKLEKKKKKKKKKKKEKKIEDRKRRRRSFSSRMHEVTTSQSPRVGLSCDVGVHVRA